MLPIFFSSIDLILWDWNGTLLDDRKVCREIINKSLAKRSLPVLSCERYLEIFQFPILDYYRALGFDFKRESFEEVGQEFIDAYARQMAGCSLHRSVRTVLELLQNAGRRQCILSALQKESLLKILAKFSLSSFFEAISGLDDYYAHGKIDTGRSLIKEVNADPARTVLIGDTVHDFEVAAALGVKCALVAAGHNAKHRLEKCGVSVFDSLEDLFELP